jgi:rhodanese-related sulfurtransferase
MKARMMILFIAAAIVLLGALYLFAQNDSTSISPSDVQKLIQSDSTVVLLDVRTPDEYRSETGHLAHAVLLPVQELERRIDELGKYREHTIVVYCRSGHRSTTASGILQKNGYHVRNMQGGITRWRAERFPVERENH